jgi:hypothetical protein
VWFADCCCAEYHYAECHYANCHGVKKSFVAQASEELSFFNISIEEQKEIGLTSNSYLM